MHQIVGIIRKHKYLGNLLLPYIVHIKSEKFLTVSNLLSAEQLDDNQQNPAISELHAFALTLDPAQLMRRFSKTATKTDHFFSTLSKPAKEKLLFPFVYHQIDSIISLMQQMQTPVYTDKNWPQLYPEDRVFIEDKHVDVQLHFKRTAEGTEYRLELYIDGVKQDLQARNKLLLGIDPCYLLIDKKLLKLSAIKNGKLIQPFLKKAEIHIPRRIEKQYYETFIRKVANHANIVTEGFEIIDLATKPRAHLTIEQNWTNQYGLSLSFDYGERVVAANSRQVVYTNLESNEAGFIFKRITRDLKWEHAQAKLLKQYGFVQQEAFFEQVDTKDKSLFALLEKLTALRPKLEERNFQLAQKLSDHYVLQKPDLFTNSRENIDWFDLNITIKVAEHSFPFIALKDHLLQGIKRFRLPSGDYFLIPDEWFEQYTGIFIHGHIQGDSIRLKKHHYTLLENTQTTAAVLQKEVQIENPTNPALHKVTLRPYQITGFHWLYHLTKRGFGAILADDMGLGKTLQTIALLADYFKNGKESHTPKPDPVHSGQLDLFAGGPRAENNEHTPHQAPALVVVPTSLVHNWKNEVNRFAPRMKVYVYAGSQRDESLRDFDAHQIILTTYGTLRLDIDILKNKVFSFAILDESQSIKNPTSKTAQAVYALQARHKIGLTGTPIENNLIDLWAQMHFVNPDLLGSLPHFKLYYSQPIAKEPDTVKKQQLQKLIAPFILRRTKAKVAPQLPPLTETLVVCEMDDAQEKLYEAEKSRYRNLVLEAAMETEKKNNIAVSVLQAMMKLRLIANHPQIAGFENLNFSGKFDHISSQLQTLCDENQKVLIFSSFVRHLKLFEKYCIENHIGYAMLTGETYKREEQIQRFRREADSRVFLISLKAGGIGLNLTEAGYVFLLDPWWNPAAEMQAISRSHRIGQDKKVFVYRFISKGSIEEKIQQLQTQKQSLADTFINERQWVNETSLENLLRLLE